MLSAENSDADLSLVAEFGGEREVFAVHKFKLITHSAVFRAMLGYNTKESSGSVCLGNLELEEVFHVMLLADKYIIPALKSICEQELIARVRPTNVAECVELADFCRANVLYECCLSLMKENRHAVFNTESWLALKERNPTFSMGIMERMMKRSRLCD
ncbi:BTB/POZ domain [Parelaphostrongylus tenuis]|uniref:BTB/POZ domain n=1 Tax=Parelaphostrongylus tenuis TaxID=148309 RepID=A0AAD5MQH5_PARTN|nr:BTB/POZ domain [Parelaphostrongylus tenuis]